MRRRTFLSLAGGAAAMPDAARAQSATAKMLRIGTANVQPRTSPNWVAFEQRLAELGYVEGQNLSIDHVQIANPDSWEAHYREVVARKPDIVIAAGPEQSLKSARAAAGTLPIVMIAVDYDPLVTGYVASLGRPGGNISGVYFQNTELVAKHLQLTKELMPDIEAAVVFWDRLSADYWSALQATAPRFGVKLTGVELGKPPFDYDAAFATLAPADRRVVIAQSSPFFFLDRATLAQSAIRNRTALMVQLRESVTSGGLMCYGASITQMFSLAATYVDRMAKGAKPAELAIQQPTKFEMVLNLRTANALGLTIPTALLAQADEVIE